MTRHIYGAALVLLFLSLAPPAGAQRYFLYTPRAATPEDRKQAQDGILVREVEVQKGDTLYGISRKHSGHGMYYPQILLFNDIRNPNLILIGDTLKVPVGNGTSTEEAAAVPVHKKKKVGRKQGTSHKSRPSAAVPARRQPAAATSATGGQLTELSLGDLKRSDKRRKKLKGSKEALPGGQKQVRTERGAVPPPVVRKPVAADEARPVGVSKQPEQRPAGTDSVAAQRLFERAIKAYRQDDCRTALDLFERFLTAYPALPQAADASLYKAECYLKLSGQ